jgi:nucleoside-diphosphate-sugar epimerase
VTSPTLAGARVLVLGASGFLGSRLVERLVCECHAEVRVLVRRVMSAAAISRFPIDPIVGDITNPADLARAMAGCRVVFNCVKGRGGDPAARRGADVDGARLVVEAAAHVGAHVVHVSTMAVYDRPEDGDFDERSPAAPAGDLYVDTKQAGERAALETGAALGVAVTVIQPTVIYGPDAGVYGTDILEEMRTHRVILVDGGRGICNAVYVDDAVTALLLAAGSDAARGERILISGSAHPTWKDFFSHFESMIGETRTAALSTDEALSLWKDASRRPSLASEWVQVLRENVPLRRRLLATREGALVKRAAERMFSEATRVRLRTPAANASTPPDGLPIAAVRPWVVRNMARRARAKIDKARTLLGYSPVFSLDDGMRLTAAWAHWAGLASREA